MSIIQTNNITKIYGDNTDNTTYAVNNISLSVEKGEFTAIMGPSGSGKSTLVSMLSGIMKATSGDIFIEGKNICTLKKSEMSAFRREKMGFVFQEFNLLDALTIKENIILPMVWNQKKVGLKQKMQMNETAEKLMKQFGIYECRDKYPYEVSGGQKQRTAVSRALVNSPSIIFADEPTGNLDSKSSNAVMECFARINDETDSTILMVTHDVFAASFCKHVLFIKDGKVHMDLVRKGDRKEFFDQILDCQAIVGGEIR